MFLLFNFFLLLVVEMVVQRLFMVCLCHNLGFKEVFDIIGEFMELVLLESKPCFFCLFA